jgi:rRNA pseudouridine-1189 N-methylase Emg1 (Nep1/Mra1 family)
MLVQLLKEDSFEVELISEKLTKDQLNSFVESGKYDAICISLHSATLMKARNLAKTLHTHFPELKIILGLWGHKEVNAETENKLKKLGIYSIAFSLAQAIEQFEKIRIITSNIIK